MVGVSATHRRRGVLRQLMERQLDDVVDRGEPLAILTASESTIYGRFGYGLSVSHVVLEIDATRSAFRAGAEPSAPGRTRLLLSRARRPVRSRPRTSGVACSGPERSPGPPRTGSCACATASAGGTAPAGCSSRSTRTPTASPTASPPTASRSTGPTRACRGTRWWSRTCAARRRRWRRSCGACCSTSTWPRRWWRFKRPVDDPIKWRLADPRRAQTNVVKDWLWLRVLDVPGALEGPRLRGHRPARARRPRSVPSLDRWALPRRRRPEVGRPAPAPTPSPISRWRSTTWAPSTSAASRRPCWPPPGRIKARSAEVVAPGRRHLQDHARAVLHDRVLSELPGCSGGPRGPDRLDRGHGAPSHRTRPPRPPAPPALPTVGASVRHGRWPGAPPGRPPPGWPGPGGGRGHAAGARPCRPGGWGRRHRDAGRFGRRVAGVVGPAGRDRLGGRGRAGEPRAGRRRSRRR